MTSNDIASIDGDPAVVQARAEARAMLARRNEEYVSDPGPRGYKAQLMRILELRAELELLESLPFLSLEDLESLADERISQALEAAQRERIRQERLDRQLIWAQLEAQGTPRHVIARLIGGIDR